MARQASKDSVAADMRPTNYRGAVQRMKAIKAKTDKQKSIASEIGDIYGKCEGVEGVNKQACKIFHGLSKLEPEDRLLVFRDLNGLLDAAGFMTEGADMVDKMHGSVVPFRLPGGDQGDDEDDGSVSDDLESFADDGSTAGDTDEIADFAGGAHVDATLPEDGFTEASEEELAAQTGRKETAAKKAVGRAKKAFGDGPPPEPYTGDNSDLAPDE